MLRESVMKPSPWRACVRTTAPLTNSRGNSISVEKIESGVELFLRVVHTPLLGSLLSYEQTLLMELSRRSAVSKYLPFHPLFAGYPVTRKQRHDCRVCQYGESRNKAQRSVEVRWDVPYSPFERSSQILARFTTRRHRLCAPAVTFALERARARANIDVMARGRGKSAPITNHHHGQLDNCERLNPGQRVYRAGDPRNSSFQVNPHSKLKRKVEDTEMAAQCIPKSGENLSQRLVARKTIRQAFNFESAHVHLAEPQGATLFRSGG